MLKFLGTCVLWQKVNIVWVYSHFSNYIRLQARYTVNHSVKIKRTMLVCDEALVQAVCSSCPSSLKHLVQSVCPLNCAVPLIYM